MRALVVDELLSGLPRLVLSWLIPKPRETEFRVGVRDEEGDIEASIDRLETSRTGVWTSSVSNESPGSLLSADMRLSRVNSESLILLAIGIGGTVFSFKYESPSTVSLKLEDRSCAPLLLVLFFRRS